MGVMADKDVPNMVALLSKYAAYFVAVTPNTSRSLPAEKLAELAREHGVSATVCGSIEDGAREALRLASRHGMPVSALGSLYFSADVRRAFAENS